MKSTFWKWLFKPVTVGLLITVVGTLAYRADFPMLQKLLQRFDFVAYDMRYQLINPFETSKKHPIVIIDIDEKSLESVGRWPWSRATVARLLEKTYQAGAVMVGVDIVFAEPEVNPVDVLLEKAQQFDADTRERLQGIRNQFDFDQKLADHLGTDTVLGYFFYASGGGLSGQLPEPVLVLDEKRVQQLVIISMGSASGNLPKLQSRALSAGYLTIIPDADGVIRRAPLVMRFKNQVYSALALEMARQYTFVENLYLNTAMQNQAEVIESIGMDKALIPTNAFGQVLVPYRGSRGSFTYVSAVDVLQGREIRELEGAIVLVGTSAWGLGDLKATPLSAEYPGVEVHANLLNGILNVLEGGGGFPHRPDLVMDLTVVLLLVEGVLLSLLLPRLSPFTLILASVLMVLLVLYVNVYVWQNTLIDVPLAPFLLMVSTLTIFFFADGFLRENLQRLQIKKMFGQYVPEAHVEKMIDTEEAYTFAGESKEMTVLFSDIRNFTTISENLNAAELKQMLNDFFTPITQIIFENQGTIDKYVGDMVMAFWGAPLEDPEHASHAVTAALQMLAKVEELKPVFKEKGLPEINIGVGINTGLMNVGDMGSEFRKAYTVLGDAVNLGSRLEGVTKFYGVKLLVGESTQARAPGFQYRLVDRIRVKGKSEPITVYEPVCAIDDCSGELAYEIARFHMALFYYYYRDWEKATIVLKDLQKLSDHPLYRLYLERIEFLKHSDLGPEWDGVYTHTSK